MSQGGFPAAAGPDLRIPAHLPFPFGSLGRAASKALAQQGEFAQLYAPWALMIAQRGTNIAVLQTADTRCLCNVR